jgi:LuxR family maltose regulon positive regulatory protein
VLERALTLAAPEGYIRTFVDEGEPIRLLLQKVKPEAHSAAMNEYIKKLLSAFLTAEAQSVKDYPSSLIASRTSRQHLQPLVDPLSARELEVLHLIAEGLSNREIASRLFITINTVKKHTRLSFDKLDVANRTHAVARARELGLL